MSTTTPRFLQPVTLEHFRATSWQCARMIVRREQPDYFASLLSIDELDRLICSTRIPATNFNLARGDEPLPLSSYCNGDFVDQRRVLALHRGGATVILRSVEQWSPALARLRCEFEETFEFEAQINVYLTPPGEKSTPPHWDTHDLFILQVTGQKRWRMFAGTRTLPLERERFRINEDEVGELDEDFVLNAGDTLYLPRGAIHEPVADSYSVHISVGIRTVRWLDVYIHVLQRLAQREGHVLRETAELFSLNCDSTPVSEQVVCAVQDATQTRAAMEELRMQVRAQHASELEGSLRARIEPFPESSQARYRRRFGCSIEVERNPEALQVRVGIERVSLPLHMSDAVAAALSGAPFTAGELPGGLSREEQEALCLALQEVGVLRVLGGPS